MKTVFNNEMCAHVWASQSQDEGRGSHGAIYFAGRALFSYGSHFVLGFHLPDGPTLLTTDSYSVTTSKHKSYTARAARHLDTIHVPGLTRLWNRISYDMTPKAMRPKIRAYVLEALQGDLSDDSARRLLAYVGLASSFDKLKAQAARIVAKKAAADKKESDRQALDLLHGYTIGQAHLTAHLQAGLLNRSHRSAADEIETAMKQIRQAQRQLGKAGTPARLWKASQAVLAALPGMAEELEKGRGAAANRQRLRNMISEYRRAWLSVGANLTDLHSRDNWNRANSIHAIGQQLDRVISSLAYISYHTNGGIPATLRNAALTRIDRLTGPKNAIAATYEAVRNAEHAERERQARLTEIERREAWFNGEPSQWRGRDAETGAAFIRATGVERDSAGTITAGTLETSEGASVPLTHAIRAFRFVKLWREKADFGRHYAGAFAEPIMWQRNGQRVRVGHFEIDAIYADGSFKAGCHAIAWPQIAALAESLGVFALPASSEAVNHA